MFNTETPYGGQYANVFFPGLSQMQGPYAYSPYGAPLYPTTGGGYGNVGLPSTFGDVGSGPTLPDNSASAPLQQSIQAGNSALPIGTALGGAAQLAYGLYLANKMKKMQDPRFTPNESFSRGLAEAQNRRNMGFTGDEQAAYEQQIGDMNRSQYSRAINLAGGNMAQTMLGILSGQESKARNQFALQDATLRRQNQQYADTYAARMQEMDNMNTQRAMSQYDAMRAAASQSIQSGIGNMGSALNAAAGTGFQVAKLAAGVPF